MKNGDGTVKGASDFMQGKSHAEFTGKKRDLPGLGIKETPRLRQELIRCLESGNGPGGFVNSGRNRVFLMGLFH